METKTHSQQFLRKRKFLLFLPLLVLPFATLLFWALGGGKGTDVQAGQQTVKGGLNMNLPDANFKEDGSLNKLSYYEKAASDSQKREDALKNDPYYQQQDRTASGQWQGASDTGLLSMKYGQNNLNTNARLNTSPYADMAYSDPNEAKVYQKLAELDKAINEAAIHTGRTKDHRDASRSNNVSVKSADIDRLEQMMNMTKNSGYDEDPEMKQLDNLMDKILEIQHPERVKEKIAHTTTKENKGQVFPVSVKRNSNHTSLLSNKESNESDLSKDGELSQNGFFPLVDDIENSPVQDNAIQAVIHETQTVVDGAIVKLRLQTDIAINGTLIPKGRFVYGQASLNGERLNIRIGSIRYKSTLSPVQLSVVDMDGMEGVYVPGTITRDVAKNSADRAIQGVGLTTLDPSLGAQAASAGIEAAKTLLNRKAKLIKVTLKAGYQVLLRDEKQKASD